MKKRKDIWTYVLITVVSALIWFWAATETREKAELAVPLSFMTPESGSWVVRVRPTETVNVTVEGSRRANAQARLLASLQIDLAAANIPLVPGRHPINVGQLLESTDLGELVSIESVEPAVLELDIDEIVTLDVPVAVDLPGVEIEGEIMVQPPTARLSMPSRVRDESVGGFSVQAVGDRTRWGHLEPNQQYEFDVPLRPPARLESLPNVTVNPARATITFTVESLTQEMMLDRVRLQIMGPPDPRDGGTRYTVELEPDQLQDVTVSVPLDLIQSIQLNETKVFAIVYLSLAEREDQIEEKRVACFTAVHPDGTAILLDGHVGDAEDERPLVRLRITPVE